MDVLLTVARLAIGTALFVFFLLGTALNWHCVWEGLIRRNPRTPSWAPFLPGFAGTASFLVLPFPQLDNWWWVPLVIDWGTVPGTLYTLGYFSVMLVRGKTFGVSREEIEGAGILEIDDYRYLQRYHMSVRQAALDAGFGSPILLDVRLRWLTVVGVQLGEAGLAELSRFENVERLDLVDTDVTKVVILGLTPLRMLRHLDLTKSHVEWSALLALAERPHLETLILRETTLGDESIDVLAELGSLQRLDLSRTSISDKGVFKLAGLPNLRKMAVVQTRATPDGIARAMAINPHLQIISDKENDENGVTS